jgi:hypothetical protein
MCRRRTPLQVGCVGRELQERRLRRKGNQRLASIQAQLVSTPASVMALSIPGRLSFQSGLFMVVSIRVGPSCKGWWLRE